MPLTQLYISPLHRKHACPCVLLSVANQILTLEWSRNLMTSQPPTSSPANTTDPRGAKSLMAIFSLALVLVLFAADIPAPIRAAWSEFALKMQLQNEAQSASPAKLSDHDIEEIANLPAQQQ